MSRIGTRAAAVTILSAAAVAVSPGVAQAGSPDLFAAICDELGPDTFVFAESARGDADRPLMIAWVDVTTTNAGTGRYVSHERVLEGRPDVTVDEVCSFDVEGGSVTLGLSFGDSATAASRPL